MSEAAAMMTLAWVLAAFILGIFIGHVGTYVPPDKQSNFFVEWLRTRHEYRMRLLAHRERWFEVDSARPRPGEWRQETKP